MNAHELARDIFTRGTSADIWLTRKQTAYMWAMFTKEVKGLDGAHRLNSTMGGAFEVNGIEYTWSARVNPNGCALLKVKEIAPAVAHIEYLVLAYRELRATGISKRECFEKLENMFPQYSENQLFDNMF